MTTQEAAEIVAGLLGKRWTAELVLSDPESVDYAFARYVTEETEVTDAMLEAGVAAFSACESRYRAINIKAAFIAMIAAKHSGMRKVEVDPLVEALNDALQIIDEAYRKYGVEFDAQDTSVAQRCRREALAKRGKMIADIPVEASSDRYAFNQFENVLREADSGHRPGTYKLAPTIDEEAVKREAREASKKCGHNFWQALIATTRELHLLRAKVGEA